MPLAIPAIISFAIMILLTPSPALAYIDPNAGGMLFQVLTPLLVAAVGTWALLRRKISMFLLRVRRRAGIQHVSNQRDDKQSGG